MDSTVIEVRSGTTETVVDLTADVGRFLAEVGAVDGLLNVWVPHATAGLVTDNPRRSVRLTFVAG